jgi:1-deoxy-D-xylulose-5-phosphate synthase
LSALDRIHSPEELRTIPREQLPEVAAELRAELVAVGASTGGHFAGSLGTVELTVALHYAFDTPRDQVVWDVGHQAYGHKALTGRRRELVKIKSADGPSGFLRRKESEYDAFGAGHAGTSVSAALGMAEAARRRGQPTRVVAVIGDGAATAGMAFEALNHAGHLRTPVSVIFNDNGMSIAPNVGGLSRTKEARKYFESLGFDYAGPVDGHDLDVLLPAVEAARDAEVPTVLHVKTRKGKGYAPAEADPFGWHATTPFDAQTGVRKKKSAAAPTWTATFAEALVRVAERDERVVAITAAMPDGTGLDHFATRFPERTYDVGIAEQHAVTFAAGMATRGLRPVCAIYSTFLQRAFDQIVHDVALQELPVVFALDRAGLVGADGPTHHGVFDFAYLRLIPHLVVAAPRDENELLSLLATGLQSGRPFALRFPRGSGPGVAMDTEPRVLPIGKAEILREGGDVALLGIGRTVAYACEAARHLADAGISATVIDARFVKPLDAELVEDVARRCRRLVVVEDHTVVGGFGSAVLEEVSARVPEAQVLRLGLPDCFIDHGDVGDQHRAAGIDAVSLANATREWLQRPSRSRNGHSDWEREPADVIDAVLPADTVP